MLLVGSDEVGRFDDKSRNEWCHGKSRRYVVRTRSGAGAKGEDTDI